MAYTAAVCGSWARAGVSEIRFQASRADELRNKEKPTKGKVPLRPTRTGQAGTQEERNVQVAVCQVRGKQLGVEAVRKRCVARSRGARCQRQRHLLPRKRNAQEHRQISARPASPSVGTQGKAYGPLGGFQGGDGGRCHERVGHPSRERWDNRTLTV